MFDCQGEMSQAVAHSLIKTGIPQLVAWGKGREETLGQPNKLRLHRARLFAREVMAKVAN